MIVATDEHPFWVAGDINSWIKAIDLEPGLWLRTSTGTYVQITHTKMWTGREQRVHNLAVADYHTYYVNAGAVPALVHNDGPPQVDNPRLQNFINALFHGLGNPNRVGDGSAIAAANHEALGGDMVEGKDHLVGTTQYRRGINRFLTEDTYRERGGRRVQVVRTGRDIQVARSVIAAIDDAHAGRYQGLENYPGLGSCT
ncbi:polymorphic toxin-type HINT domain-containing protein [Actinomadura adrarensis]|uniref:Polymorphic toxin-type HINT domain-containing protein n=1 Tax=Actinomadura adrarensis TaxID=1819600 RepID=A0ABW3CT74_9ACTN